MHPTWRCPACLRTPRQEPGRRRTGRIRKTTPSWQGEVDNLRHKNVQGLCREESTPFVGYVSDKAVVQIATPVSSGRTKADPAAVQDLEMSTITLFGSSLWVFTEISWQRPKKQSFTDVEKKHEGSNPQIGHLDEYVRIENELRRRRALKSKRSYLPRPSNTAPFLSWLLCCCDSHSPEGEEDSRFLLHVVGCHKLLACRPSMLLHVVRP